MPRETGFYWVKHYVDGDWEVAEFEQYPGRPGQWWFIASEDPFIPEPEVIGPKIEPPKNLNEQFSADYDYEGLRPGCISLGQAIR